jgi:hypothetical protein
VPLFNISHRISAAVNSISGHRRCDTPLLRRYKYVKDTQYIKEPTRLRNKKPMLGFWFRLSRSLIQAACAVVHMQSSTPIIDPGHAQAGVHGDD